MKTIKAELGVGALQTSANSPFVVPARQWNNITSFLDGVNGASADSTRNFVSLMPAYADLRKCAADWTVTTYPDLIALANGISQYGFHVATVVYPQLDAMLKLWTATAPSKSQQSSFTQLFQPTLDAARKNGQLAANLASQLQLLGSAVAVINQELPGAISNLMADAMGDPGSSDPSSLANHLVDQINAISGQLAQLASLLSAVGTPPLTDIQRVQGAWGGISDDLQGLYNNVLTQIVSEEPFIADLDIQVAIAEWQAIASEAQAFANSTRSSAVAA
jgi:hypothetical protein